MFTKQQQLGEKEKAFLRKVVGFYETFTQESAESAEARFLLAKGYFTIAHLRAFLGEHRDAVAGYRQTEPLLEQLAAEFPDVAEYRATLARTEGSLAIELARLGKQAESETALLRGITMRTQLADEFPENLRYRRELADNYNDLGALREAVQHNYAEAEEIYRHALELKKKLIEQAGDAPEYRRSYIWGLSTLGQVLRFQGTYAESERLYRQAVIAQEEQISKGPATAKDPS
jgi:tetratricopeptide (TPR) repeat protein